MPILLQKLLAFFPKTIQFMALIVACTVWLGNQINTSINEGFERMVYEARIPAYAIIKNQIDKQMEKLSSDPTDIKRVDLRFLFEQCSGDFGHDYIPNLPPADRLTAKRSCSKLEELYLSEMSSA